MKYFQRSNIRYHKNHLSQMYIIMNQCHGKNTIVTVTMYPLSSLCNFFYCHFSSSPTWLFAKFAIVEMFKDNRVHIYILWGQLFCNAPIFHLLEHFLSKFNANTKHTNEWPQSKSAYTLNVYIDKNICGLWSEKRSPRKC